MPTQRDMFKEAVLDAYAEHDSLTNDELYQKVGQSLSIDPDAGHHLQPVGKDGTIRSVYTRTVRFVQQDLKSSGMIQRVGRGQWKLTREGKQTLTQIDVDKHMVACSTDLGVAIWGNSVNVFDKVLDDDVHLCVTSPPYLGIKRSYGTYHEENEHIDFIIKVLSPIRRKMIAGANLVLNISNDSILKKRHGERSLYLEKLTIRLSEELGLFLMDRIPWYAPDKSPKGYQVTHARTHLTSRYEPLLWFCTDPSRNLADNRRVLTPYSEQMKKMIENGGETRGRADSDYQPNARKGGFSADNGGSIPGNVLIHPTNCSYNRKVLKYADQLNLPRHGALFPQSLVSDIIEWLCPEYGLVVDPFGGYATTGAAAQAANRRWMTCELFWEYVRPCLVRFEQCEGYYVNPLLTRLDDKSLRYHLAA